MEEEKSKNLKRREGGKVERGGMLREIEERGLEKGKRRKGERERNTRKE